MSLSARVQTPAAAGPFSPVTLFFLLVVGASAFVGFGVLAAYAPDLKATVQGGGNALSRSAVGYAGIVRLLTETGTPAPVSRGRTSPHSAAGLLVLTPEPGASVNALATARGHDNRRVLIVLPKWSTAPDPKHFAWVRSNGLVEAPQAVSAVKDHGVSGVLHLDGVASPTVTGVGGGFANLDPAPVGPIDSLQTVQVAGATPLLADARGRPLLVRLDPQTFLLSDPDLMDDQGVHDLRTAREALSILYELRGGQGPVVFDVTLNGFGHPRSLLKLATQPPFLGASLCVLAAAALMGAHAGVRFGPAMTAPRSVALGKRALVDNATMLIALARREPRMAVRYVAATRRALAPTVATATQGSLTPDKVDAALDRLTPAGEAPFSTLAGEARAVTDIAGLMRSAERLHQRRVEILGERH